MPYEQERKWIIQGMQTAYRQFAQNGPSSISQKSAFDLVTEVDVQIEAFLSDWILQAFPTDKIQGEELHSHQKITGRTWVIDPIDGTCNFAHGISAYGLQCCLFAEGVPQMAVIYLPQQDLTYWAIAGEGAYCNDLPCHVAAHSQPQEALISLGDFTHSSADLAARQYDAVAYLYPRVAKLRMYGAACVDFALFASGKLAATAFTTRNLWDIAPGILISQEAGAIVTGLNGEPYDFQQEGVILAANAQLSQLMIQAFSGIAHCYAGISQSLRGFIFDFDGVVVDTEAYHYRSWAMAADHVGYPFTWEEYLPFKSKGNRETIAYLCRQAGVPLTDALFAEMKEIKETGFDRIIQDLSEQDVLPGIREFLTWLNHKHIPTAVASSSSTSTGLAQRFGLTHHFQVFIDGNQKLPRKPAPDTFLLAAERLGRKPEECIVFEDSLAGIEAAARAGMPVVAVGGIRSEKALLHIQDFRDILSYFA